MLPSALISISTNQYQYQYQYFGLIGAVAPKPGPLQLHSHIICHSKCIAPNGHCHNDCMYCAPFPLELGIQIWGARVTGSCMLPSMLTYYLLQVALLSSSFHH